MGGIAVNGEQFNLKGLFPVKNAIALAMIRILRTAGRFPTGMRGNTPDTLLSLPGRCADAPYRFVRELFDRALAELRTTHPRG